MRPETGIGIAASRLRIGISISSGHVIATGTEPSVRLGISLGALLLLILSACKLPEQKLAYYPGGCLKERYWVYRENGREVMNGLYTSWFPNGQPEVEILYREGAEVTKTYYSERGFFMGRVDLVSAREP
jgi:hypothetical protein